jgi:hypothetical protein
MHINLLHAHSFAEMRCKNVFFIGGCECVIIIIILIQQTPDGQRGLEIVLHTKLTPSRL